MLRSILTPHLVIRFALLVAAMLALAPRAVAQPRYPTIVPLPLFSSEYHVYEITGINHAGTVVGTIAATNSGPAAWSAIGTPLTIQGLGGPGTFGSFGWDINDNGILAGSSGGKAMLATLGQTGLAINLHNLLPGPPNSSEAWDINNSGRACVTAVANTGQGLPYLYNGSSMVALPMPAGSASAFTSAINTSGDIVGTADFQGSGDGKAILWSGGTAVSLAPLPGRPLAFATDINDAGVVVGVGHGPSVTNRAVIWQNGVPTDLGDLPTPLNGYQARGINASNQVVGFGLGATAQGDRGFLWEAGVMRPLASLVAPNTGWVFKHAGAINDRGWIAGVGIAPNGVETPFLMTTQPINDAPCAAILVTTTPFVDQPNGPEASDDVALPCDQPSGASTTSHGVWYRLSPSTPTTLRVHNSTSDPLVFGLFTGPSCNQLTRIDCKTGNNSDQAADNTAHFNLFNGINYWLLAGTLNGGQPAGAYHLTFDYLVPNGACCTAEGCTMTTESACGGSFRGPFQYCGDDPQYESLDVAAIPDAGPATPDVLTRTISIAGGGLVENDLKVVLNVVHARIGDLIIRLTAPDGTVQDLINRVDDVPGGCPPFGDSGRQTALGGRYIFDDQSVNPYGPAMALAARYFDAPGLVVAPGHYQPTTCADVVVSLNSTFAGHGLAGTWTLTLSDNQVGGAGTLNSWGLIVDGGNRPACQCKAGDVLIDQQVNGRDIQPFVSCLVSGVGSACLCADINGDSVVGVDDIPPFVSRLLASN